MFSTDLTHTWHSGRLNGKLKTLVAGSEVREYIVGGKAFPLLSWLITPYESDRTSTLTSDFNAAHKSARSLAVKALSQLKGSWRILSKVMWRPDKQKLPSIILVCCLLHNIMIDTGDRLNRDVALSEHHDSGYEEVLCKQAADTLGETMREKLARHLQCVKESTIGLN